MLLWFRNDIRVLDNPALDYFLSRLPKNKQGNAVFFVSQKQWQLHNWSPSKIDFILRHLELLKRQLTQLNVSLEIIEVNTFDEQVDFLVNRCAKQHIDTIVVNRELEFNENQRDKQCIERGLTLKSFEADVIVPKGAVLNKSGHMFKVFTPFKRAWLAYLKDNGVKVIDRYRLGQKEMISHCKEYELSHHPISGEWPLVSTVEQELVPNFLRAKLRDYAQDRDTPSIKGTSGLSPYLAAGVLSPRYLIRQLINLYPDILTAIDVPEFTWLNELIWRDFYRHLVFHHQGLSKQLCFNAKYQQLNWLNNKHYFDAWCQGKTGYPIVDAAMRQLVQTGWMHNRLRMIVASFLTKHLLVDWRWGEKFFMQHLIDGDLAANNGGWQWAASTGCDAQPYFRIFNPIRQSERFDPDGTFIRQFLPELNNVPAKQIHFPHRYLKQQQLATYWPPIVEHKQARLDALAFYK